MIELEKVTFYFTSFIKVSMFYSVRTALKSSDNIKRSFEKGSEVEESFGRSSLSFRVDQMTLQQRQIIMERQKNIADDNMVNEINCFSNMLKVCG